MMEYCRIFVKMDRRMDDDDSLTSVLDFSISSRVNCGIEDVEVAILESYGRGQQQQQMGGVYFLFFYPACLNTLSRTYK
jgi:hypothetical protein